MIYIILVVLLAAGYFFLQSKYKLFCLYAFILITIVSGFRDINVGFDTSGSYFRGYLFQNALGINDIIENEQVGGFEKGFTILEYIVAHFVGTSLYGYFIFIFITSFITCFFFTLAIYRSKVNPLMGFIMYIAFDLFSFSMSAIRQSLAMSLVLFGFTLLREKKYVYYILINLLAGTMHQSAFICLALPILLNIKLSIKNQVILLLVLIAIISVTSTILTPIIDTYFAEKEYDAFTEKSGTSYLALFYFCFCALNIIERIFDYRNGIKDKNYIFFWLFIIQAFVGSFITINALIFRINLYFLIITVCFYIPYILQNRKKATIIKLTYIVISIAYFGYYVIYKDDCGIFPYKSILSIFN
jgi:hypothetical protein